MHQSKMNADKAKANDISIKMNVLMAGGIEHTGVSPMQAAELFAKEYLPNLEVESVSLPREIVDYGTSTQMPHFTQEETIQKLEELRDENIRFFATQIMPHLKEEEIIPKMEKLKKAKKDEQFLIFKAEMPHLNEKEIFQKMKELKENNEDEKFRIFTDEHMQGAKNEVKVFNYLKHCLQDSTTAMFWSYKQEDVWKFIGTSPSENQEYDIILLLPESKQFIVIEVKSYESNVKVKSLNSLKKGLHFYNHLKQFIGEKMFNNWEYIPVLALPNVKTRQDIENKTPIVLFPKAAEGENKHTVVLITDKEIISKTPFDILHNKIKNNSNETEIGYGSDSNDAYIALVKILYASQHVAKVEKAEGDNNTIELCPPTSPSQMTQSKLLGLETKSVSSGFEGSLEIPSVSNFSSLKNKPIGSIESILFWNPIQLKTLKSNFKNKVIVGEYGSGKSLLLMAEVQQCLDRKENVIFMTDLRWSSTIFDRTMEAYCGKRSIPFHDLRFTRDADHESDSEELKSILEKNKESCIFIDELGRDSLKIVSSLTEKYPVNKVVCAINPNREASLKNRYKRMIPEVPKGWELVKLTKVMRNSSNICHVANSLLGFPQEDWYEASTVHGLKPKLILVEDYNDFIDYGLSLAMKLVRNEDKFVIIVNENLETIFYTEDSFHDDNIEERSRIIGLMRSVVKTHIPDMPVFRFNDDLMEDEENGHEGEEEKFLAAAKGCFITHGEGFGGMQTRCLILVCLAENDHLLKDCIMRCSANLVIIHSMFGKPDFKVGYLKSCDIIIPYENDSEKEKNVLGEIERAFTKEEYNEILYNICLTKKLISD